MPYRHVVKDSDEHVQYLLDVSTLAEAFGDKVSAARALGLGRGAFYMVESRPPATWTSARIRAIAEALLRKAVTPGDITRFVAGLKQTKRGGTLEAVAKWLGMHDDGRPAPVARAAKQAKAAQPVVVKALPSPPSPRPMSEIRFTIDGLAKLDEEMGLVIRDVVDLAETSQPLVRYGLHALSRRLTELRDEFLGPFRPTVPMNGSDAKPIE